MKQGQADLARSFRIPLFGENVSASLNDDRIALPPVPFFTAVISKTLTEYKTYGTITTSLCAEFVAAQTDQAINLSGFMRLGRKPAADE